MTEQDKIVVLQDNHRLRAENETLRKERDEARREVSMRMRKNPERQREFALGRGWDCFKEQQPRWKSDPNIISLDELERCTRNQTP